MSGILISLLAAAIPMLIYLSVIWLMDKNEREPFGLVLLNFFWGAFGAIFLTLLFNPLLKSALDFIIPDISILESKSSDLTGAIIIAPILEEFTKGIFLFFFSFNKKFDGVVDGLVYGAAIGLGFGMTENFLYFISAKQQLFLLIVIRTLFSALLHATSQATLGIFIGYSKFKPLPMKIILIPLGYILAVLIHFIWNFSVSLTGYTLIGFTFMFLYIITTIIIFQIAIKLEAQIINKGLIEEAQNGIIPYEHLRYLPFVFLRKRSGWFPDEKNRKEYIKSTVLLALRKSQLKGVSDKKRDSYLNEIIYLRTKIAILLNKT
ncbi:MAG: PrsW family intramembrane metalloprotease [Ignavibacteria bacterium]|nr:PrsW family intramembrane metalloprotease [Ignavibacteria bacterium]